MSHFLDQNSPYFNSLPFPNPNIPKKIHNQQNIKDQNNEIVEANEYWLQKGLGQYGKIEQNDESIGLDIVHKGRVGGEIVILQNIRYDRVLKCWQNSMQTMDKHGNYLKIHNTDKIIYLYSYFTNKFKCLLIRLSINPVNGLIKLTIPYLIRPSNIQVNSKTFANQARKIIQQTYNFIHKNQHIFMEVYQNSNKQAHKKAKELPSTIKKYMNKFGLHFTLGTPEQQAEFQMNKQEQLQRNSRIKILQRQIMLQPDDKKLLQLYLECRQNVDRRLSESDLQFHSSQMQSAKERVRMPGVANPKSAFQNNYILNSIKIDKYLQMNPLPINHGGFTNIYLAEVQFWYVYSGRPDQVLAPVGQQSFTKDKLIKKLMIIKKEEKRQKFTLRNRIEHQKNILMQIKNGKALFIPKYYISSDENYFKQDLLSDFVMLPNLLQYVMANKLTLSLRSKIYILFTLTQSLRYLKCYRIVHLDLKPNNIMISRTMMVKIIDFGQSYHPKICPQVYAPGFTMPYSSPQSFYPSQSFSQKNDIFSIGVISYEILYDRFPFFLYDQKTHSQIYKYKEYTDHWFYNPEELKNYGDNQLFPLLQLILGRCLDPNPAKRPQLDWLCLILRECLDFY